ncbi:MAG: hypothetical protein GY811_16305 [Myxococcales bacterium]|nr:hypothetical protein [Myxococcales bacterium]
MENRVAEGFGRRRERYILATAGLLCVALPLLARHALTERVSVDLAAQASASLGLPIELGQATVGLTGTLEIQNIRVGGFFRAKRVMASIAPSASTARGLAPNELLIDGPSLQLEVDRHGNTNLDDALALRSENTSEDSEKAKSLPGSRLRTLRFVNGTLSIKLANVGTIESEGINLWMRDGKVHARFGNTALDLHRDAFRVEGTMPRAALDYRRGDGLHRLLADGGAIQVIAPRGRGMLKEVMLAVGVDGDRIQMSAQTGIDRAAGSIRLDAQPTLKGHSVVATLEGTPLALFAPWIPKSIDPRHTLVSGEFTVGGELRSRTAVDLAVRGGEFRNLRVNEPALSRRRIDFDLAIDATASLRKTVAGPLLQAKIKSVRSGDLSLSGAASGQWRAGQLLPDLANFSLNLGEVRCDAALNSLPVGLRPSLAGLELRGTIKSRLLVDVARSSSEKTYLEVESGIEGCKVAADPPTADTSALARDYEHRTPDGRSRILASSNPDFVRYKNMPSYVPKTFVAAEDARFFVHEGFDTHQIERSLAIDMENGKLLRGGSTISQQLVKNLFLNRRRSLARKLQEAILTWRLEANLSKKRILEIYLNIIELGDRDTYGIAEASERWFGIEPRELSILQTAFLAALTPEPTSMSARVREAGGLDAVSAGRVATILRVMRRAKVISSSEYRKAKSQRLELRSQDPHQRTAASLETTAN